jgi:hypothetical protein
VLFEHAPARGHPAFTGDRTAFDVLIRGRTPTGQRAFCKVEMKCSEDLRESAPPTIRERYGHIAPSFTINPEEPTLRTPPLQQLFRLHSLAECMLDRALADMSVFLFVPPRLNTPPQAAAGASFWIRDEVKFHFCPSPWSGCSKLSLPRASASSPAGFTGATPTSGCWMVKSRLPWWTKPTRRVRRPRSRTQALHGSI